MSLTVRLPIYLFLIGLLGLCTGCVGTVQQTQTPKTAIAAEPTGNIGFMGVHQAIPISQDKIEVFFYPATGGSEKYNYIIYVGDRALPYSVPSEVMAPDYRGLLKYTVTGLEPAKTYIIKVEAIDQFGGGKDNNTILATATTFSNLVSDFVGISSVSNSSGTDGLDSIIVRWTHASIDYSNVTGTAWTDPKTYEIVAVDADLLTPGDMDNTTFTQEQGRYVKAVDYLPTVNTAVLRGLKSNTKYYVRVRAIHKGSVEDANTPQLRGERNTKYLEIKTLNGDMASISFDPDGLVVTRNTGFSQSSSLLLNWPVVFGVFDHIRIYYTLEENGTPNISPGAECNVQADNMTSCKKLPPSATNTTIPNLLANSTYNFRMVICQDVECNVSLMGLQKTGNTNPQMAGFTGIESVDVATTVNELGQLVLRYAIPDFTKGDFDGLIVGYAATTDFSSYAKVSESDYVGPIEVQNFNFRTDNSITITGVDYLDGGVKCFTIYPFVWEDGVMVEFPNDVWKCVIPEVEPPDEFQFPGITSAASNGYNLLVNWDVPTGGIYDSYEVFIRKTPGAFSFSQAINETEAGNFTNYDRYLLPWYLTSYTLTNLPLFGSYQVGVLSYFVYGVDDIFRSETNEGILKCIIDAEINGFGQYVSKDCVPAI